MQSVRIKDVDFDIQQLLGRPVVEPVPELMCENNTGKVVMVTGAGGSIGSEICRQLGHLAPAMLILYEMNEYALYSIQIELLRLFPNMRVIPILGSVLNRNRVEATILKFKVRTIYHAAAYKHVPMVEYNMTEGVYNNVIGTATVAQAADECFVDTFVLVSTDKAVRPTNVMGASKRLSEMYIQAISKISFTKFSIVRFGNVLGSSGSVLPLFLEQLSRNEPLTITHPDITRYFMSIPEAAQLVIQAGALAQGGEVFLLDMGEPVKILQLALNLLHHFGFDANDINITGLRPGEKLYEELLINGDEEETSHPKIKRAQEPWVGILTMDDYVSRVKVYCDHMDYNRLLDLLREAVVDFNHSGIISDNLYVDQ